MSARQRAQVRRRKRREAQVADWFEHVHGWRPTGSLLRHHVKSISMLVKINELEYKLGFTDRLYPPFPLRNITDTDRRSGP